MCMYVCVTHLVRVRPAGHFCQKFDIGIFSDTANAMIVILTVLYAFIVVSYTYYPTFAQNIIYVKYPFFTSSEWQIAAP